MNKLACILAIALFAGVFAAQASAMEMTPPYYYDGESPGDYYQVIFDGEGEATVLARFTKMNIGKEPIFQLDMEIPGEHVKLKYVFQEVEEKTCTLECSSYISECVESEKVCKAWDPETETCEEWEDRCSRYEDVCVDYHEVCDHYGWTTFVPLDVKEQHLSKSTRYTIDLEQPIYPTETGTILVYYKADGYVEKGFAYDFDFETAKFPMDTEYVRVSVSTDADLYLKGSDSRVDYHPNFEGYAVEASAGMAMSAEASSYFRDISDNVRYARGFVKEAHSLDPWESFHVTGKYIKEEYKWALHLNWIAVLVLACIALKLFWKPIAKRLKLPKGKFARIIGYSFLSGFFLVLVGFVLMVILRGISYWIGWQYEALFAISLLGIMGITLGTIVAWPAYKNGKQYGFAAGMVTLIGSVLFASILVALLAVVLGG